jgi:hypothetical protein
MDFFLNFTKLFLNTAGKSEKLPLGKPCIPNLKAKQHHSKFN